MIKTRQFLLSLLFFSVLCSSSIFSGFKVPIYYTSSLSMGYDNNLFRLSDLNLDEDNISKLSNKGIKNKDDLAELSVDELQEIIEISSDDASKMIMKAREHWFNE